jgi:hypothetical protein
MHRLALEQLQAIARSRLSVPTLADRNSDSLDFHDISVAGLRAALRDSYEAGFKAGFARELCIEAAVYASNTDRFPWQIFCSEDRCVLISRDLRDHLVIASSYCRGDDDRHRVAIETLPLQLLDIVRRELFGGQR